MNRSSKIALGVGVGVGAAWLLTRGSAPFTEGSGAFIFGDQSVPTEAPVRNWHETGMGFGGLRDRKRTRGVVLHFSGSPVGSPSSTYRTLIQRNLSVQLALGRDGVFYQFCDLNARGIHANIANDDFLGIEISGDGHYTAAQVKSLFAGLKTILRYYGLPWAVPMSGGSVVTGVLPKFEFLSFSGIIGHYMVNPEKTDPGVNLMQAVATRDPSYVV